MKYFFPLFLFLLFSNPIFAGVDDESLLHQFLMNEAEEYLGYQTNRSRLTQPQLPFSIFSEDDSDFRLDELDFRTRARIRTRGDGAKDDEKAIQGQLRLRGSVHLLDDSLSIVIGGRTGDRIDSGFNQLSGGRDQQVHFNVRNLYGELKPLNGMKFTAGSFFPYYGLGSERTLKDADSYITGYRLQLDLKTLCKDSLGRIIERVTAESSFFGDETKENVFSRLDRMGNNNDNSFLVESTELVDGFQVAVGFEHFSHQDFLPIQARYRIDKITIKEVVTESLLELGRERSHSFGIHAISQPVERLTIRLGVTLISDDFDLPHGDKYPAGERFDLIVTYFLPYGFFVEGFYSDEIKHIDDLDQIRAEFVVGFDAMKFYEELKKE